MAEPQSSDGNQLMRYLTLQSGRFLWDIALSMDTGFAGLKWGSTVTGWPIDTNQLPPYLTANLNLCRLVHQLLAVGCVVRGCF